LRTGEDVSDNNNADILIVIWKNNNFKTDFWDLIDKKMDSENERYNKEELKEIEFLIRKLNKGLSQNKYIGNKIAIQKPTNIDN